MKKKTAERLARLSPADRQAFFKSLLSKIAQQAGLESQEPIPSQEPIAVVGIGCCFPGGAIDPESFWKILKDGTDVISEVPPERWSIDDYYSDDLAAPGRMSTRWGGFIGGVDQFDPEFFGISAWEAQEMDPQQRIILQASYEALENAGVPPFGLKGSKTGVFVGVFSEDYTELQSQHPENLTAYSATGSNSSVIAGRLSYIVGLQGPSLTVNTACSSSAVAIHLACRSLLEGECNQAIAGGVNLILTPDKTIAFSKANMMAQDGRCKTFDASANGYVRSEGCGVLVLRRLSDAIASGDRILAVIRATAVNQDGISNGLTAPNGPAQEALIRQALATASIKPEEVTYFETHGTGTALGDPMEVMALGNVMKEGRSIDNPLILGSVKTNIGHTESAAGVAGVIKVVLSMAKGIIPRHLHFKNLNRNILIDKIPAVIPVQEMKWPNGKRIAAVSSFGFSGTNAHILLEESPQNRSEPKPGAIERSTHVLPVSAKNEASLLELARRYADFLENHPAENLADICFTACSGRSHYAERVAFVGSSREEILNSIGAFLLGRRVRSHKRGTLKPGHTPKIAFMFSGQGSQYSGMAKELYETEPVFKAHLDECAEIIKSEREKSLLDVIFRPESEELLNTTEYTQLCLFAIEYSLAQLWRSWGVEPTVVMGHSVGEYVAACVAGVMSVEDGLKLTAKRAALMQSVSGHGEMASVPISEKHALEYLQGYQDQLSIAAINGPQSVVIAGDRVALREVIQKIELDGAKATYLTVSHAFHSPQVAPILDEFERCADSFKYEDSRIQLVSNLTGKIVGKGEINGRYWRTHLRNAVRFSDGVSALLDEGATIFLEIGPGTTLCGMAYSATVAQRYEGVDELHFVPSIRKGKNDTHQILEAVAWLYSVGIPIDWAGFEKNTPRRHKVAIPTYAFQKRRFWLRAGSASKPIEVVSSGHPLIGKVQPSDEANHEFEFEFELSLKTHTFLKDHVIYGMAVVPGATYVEMGIAAAKAVFGRSGAVRIDEMMIKNPLLLPENQTRRVRLTLTREEKNAGSYRIMSQDAADSSGEWLTHVIGNVCLVEDARPQGFIDLSLQEIKQRCAAQQSPNEHYATYAELGLDYGPQFRVIDQLFRSDREFLGHVRLAEGLQQSARSYFLHPVALDGCLQLFNDVFSINKAAGIEALLTLPFGIEQFTFYKTPVGSIWCIMEMAAGSDKSGKSMTLNFRVYDESGSIVADALNYTNVEAPKDLLLKTLSGTTSATSGESWFYERQWIEKRHSLIAPNQKKYHWLIFGDQLGVGKSVASRLVADGHKVQLVDADLRNKTVVEIAAIVDSAVQTSSSSQPVSKILHLSSIDYRSPADLEQAQRAGVVSLISIIQSCLKHGSAGSPQIYVVTQGAQRVSQEQKTVNFSQTPVWAVGRALSVENPEFKLVSVDMDPEESDSLKLADSVCGELSTNEDENLIALRENGRWVCRLERSAKAKVLADTAQDAASVVRGDATYLITGGLGALGLQLARMLTVRGAKNLILLGRRSLPPNGQALLDEMEKSGVNVKYVPVDIADGKSLSEKVNQALTGQPALRGIFHTAGLMDFRYLYEESWDHYHQIFAGKAIGAFNLHEMTLDHPLDLFVLFSSAAAFMPAPGQASYAAANAFLDGLADYRLALGLPVLCVNWGVWSGSGMATTADGSGEQRNWAKGGVDVIPPERGMEILARLMDQDAGKITVLLADWAKYLEALPGEANTSLFSNFRRASPAKKRASATAVSAEATGQFADSLKGLTAADGREKLKKFIESEIIDALGLAPGTSIDPRQGLMAMGMDSLMAVEFRNQLKQKLGISSGKSLPATLLFQYPNVEALVEFMATKVFSFDSAPAVERKQKRRALQDDPIAVIGMSGRFPGGANSNEDFWKLLSEGRSGLCEVPKDRFDVHKYFDPNPNTRGKMYTKVGGFLTDLTPDQFDPEFFNFSPIEAAGSDPQLRMLLEVSWEAFENAGESPLELFGTQTGIFIGEMWNDYLEIEYAAQDPRDLERFEGMLASESNLPGRMAYFYGFQGPTMLIDTACSSSLVSIHVACQSLRNGDCERAVAGGVNALLSPHVFIRMCRLHALSPTGDSLTFDSRANGYVRAEGCGVLILKRLSDAVASGDRVLAVIRGSAVKHGGRSISPTAPNVESQEKLIRRAIEVAGVKPADIEYFEAHGTGTPLGDPIEMQAVGNVLREGRDESKPLVVSSVKTNIGHAEGAAGVAGVIKTILALNHNAIPPHLNLKELNPNISLDEIPAVIPMKLTPWEPKQGKKRLAGVSSFGMTGVIAHAILEEAPVTEAVENSSAFERPAHILTLSARSQTALTDLANRYVAFFQASEIENLADVCFTANVGRSHFAHRLALIGTSRADLNSKLVAYSKDETASGVISGEIVTGLDESKIGFLFTGQGSQYTGMGRELYKTQPVFRDVIDRCEKILAQYLKTPLREVLFNGSNDLIDQTEYTQPCLFAVEYALSQLWMSWGIKPRAVLGHSVGEYVAACVAGVFTLEDGLKLIAHRARLMQSIEGEGAMVAIALSEEKVRDAIAPYSSEVSVGAVNGPESVVISGYSNRVLELAKVFESSGAKIKRLNVSHAFHSPQMNAILDEFERIAEEVKFEKPNLTFISNLTGEKYDGDFTAMYWREHIRETVRFSSGIQAMTKEGVNHFLEVGPGRTLVGMGAQSIAPLNHKLNWDVSLMKGRADWDVILETLAKFYTVGAKIDWRGFENGYSRRKKVSLPTYAFQNRRYWVEESKGGVIRKGSKHPLIGSRVDVAPTGKQYIFETEFTPENLPRDLRDHQVLGELVVPGAAYIEMVLEAAQELDPGMKVLRDITIEQPLILGNHQKVQVVFTANDDKFDFAIFSQTVGEDGPRTRDWICHCRGQMKRNRPAHAMPPILLADRQAVCTEEADRQACYSEFLKKGLEYGPSYLGIQRIWRGDTQVLAKIRLPEAEDSLDKHAYFMNPILLDASFQAMALAIPSADKLYLPVGLEQLILHERLPIEFWCHVVLRPTKSENIYTADLTLFTEERCLAEISGFSLAHAPREALFKNLKKFQNISDWFSRAVWQAEAHAQELASDGSWVVFSGHNAMRDAIVKVLESAGAKVLVVTKPEADVDGYVRIFDSLKHQVSHVVHLWSPPTTSSGFDPDAESAQQIGYTSALRVTQAILRSKSTSQARLCLVTSGAQSIDSEEPRLSDAPLLGLGKVIAIEIPDLKCIRIDLDTQIENPIEIARRLLGECSSSRSPYDDQVAFRGDKRLVRRVVRVTPEELAPTKQSETVGLKKDSVYLITGGMGALGLQVARYLVEAGAGHVALVGRNQPKKDAQKVILELSERSKIHVVTGDISVADDVRRILKEINKMGAPLKGVVHAAGVLAGAAILGQTEKSFAAVMAPKAYGAWHLHQATENLDLDFFVMFSSISSAFGVAGQANYAAANSFLDSLANYRQAKGLPGQSIQWGPWADGGMAAGLGEMQQRKMARDGLIELDAAAALRAFGTALRMPNAELVIAHMDWAQYLKDDASARSLGFFANVAPALKPSRTQESRIAKNENLLDLLRAASDGEKPEIIERFLQSEVAKILGIEDGIVDVKRDLMSMGMDSLAAMDLGNRLKKTLGKENSKKIGATFAFQHPSIESMVQFLIEDVLAFDRKNLAG